ncbi:hypothetical protein [Acidiphilium sp.]|uniref:hypothetical protein n=1 Tax=Acidiphilium sp. TaxID=527 RepID=UPI003D01503E
MTRWRRFSGFHFVASGVGLARPKGSTPVIAALAFMPGFGAERWPRDRGAARDDGAERGAGRRRIDERAAGAV